MNNYETMFVFSVAKGEESVKALVEKFTALVEKHGTLESAVPFGSNEGVRTLAYPINDETSGAYILMNYASAPEFPAELERIANITEGVLRVLTVRK
ncbi:MAG: 30S ribosomal protein S6 [Oscillospiraceae bacterium]|nr:30S ribosomal protein S6 [Oscillospiraceae bacterium]MDD6146918.1 30S ribosomal protein S6 [Oscillospiraceae bacterium]